MRKGRLGQRWRLKGFADHLQIADIDWAVGAIHCIRETALAGSLPYCERWFMYAEDLDLCWRLRQCGWKVVLDGTVTVPHAGNAAGEVGWGSEREVQWMDAVYDWYRLERGPAAVRTWAAINLIAATTKVMFIHAACAVRPSLRTRLRNRASLRRGVVTTHGRKLLSGGKPDLASKRPREPSPG